MLLGFLAVLEAPVFPVVPAGLECLAGPAGLECLEGLVDPVVQQKALLCSWKSLPLS